MSHFYGNHMEYHELLPSESCTWTTQFSLASKPCLRNESFSDHPLIYWKQPFLNVSHLIQCSRNFKVIYKVASLVCQLPHFECNVLAHVIHLWYCYLSTVIHNASIHFSLMLTGINKGAMTHEWTQLCRRKKKKVNNGKSCWLYYQMALFYVLMFVFIVYDTFGSSSLWNISFNFLWVSR